MPYQLQNSHLEEFFNRRLESVSNWLKQLREVEFEQPNNVGKTITNVSVPLFQWQKYSYTAHWHV